MKSSVITKSLLVVAILAAWICWPSPEPEKPVGGEEQRVARLPTKSPSSYFFSQRAFPQVQIDLSAINAARLSVKAMKNVLPPGVAAVGQGATWRQAGPYNIQGRVTDIAVDPRNDLVAYVAAAEGGIFRTTDGGKSWIALFDDQSSLSMGTIALDPNNPDVVFAGTGEVNPGGGSVAYGGTGLYRSDDQGETWSLIGLENSGAIGRIAIHPDDSDIIHVAAMGHLWANGPDRGVFRTIDGGKNWTRVLFFNDTTGCVDLIQRPDQPHVLLAAMWQRLRQPEAFDYGGIGCRVYRSDDIGLTWNLVGGGLPTPSDNGGRIGLALCQSNPDVMCAVYADRSGLFDGLFRSTNGGTTWTQTNDGALSGAFATFGWWFGNVRIHPQNENQIFVVGFELYRSTNAGGSYNVVGNNMHVDHHALSFGSNDKGPSRIYAGNDGGVYVSFNGSSWDRVIGDLPITQAYRVAVADWNSDALWIGAQDNGTAQDLEGDGDFQGIFGGDGFQPVPHLIDPNRIWAQFQYGNVFFSNDSGDGFIDARNGLFGRTNWNAPHASDLNDPSTRYFGTDRIFRNDGNTSWTAISGDLTGGSHAGNNGQVNGTLTTIAVSPADSDVLWAGSDDGFVHVSVDRGDTWMDVSAGIPERWITSIAPHPTEPMTALLSVSGFRWNENVAHVYRTTNGGNTWMNIDGDLPDVPVNDVIVDPQFPDRYYIGTDVGVFQTVSGNNHWSLLGTGLPNVVVTDLAFQSANRMLVAGTYGRSIFKLELPGQESKFWLPILQSNAADC